MITPAIKALPTAALETLRQMATDRGLRQMADQLQDLINFRNPRLIRVTKVADGRMTRVWVETDPIIVADPVPDIQRTASKPSHASWKEMDRKHHYRVGCPWFGCPQCGDTDSDGMFVTGMSVMRLHGTKHNKCWDCGHEWVSGTTKRKVADDSRKVAREIVNGMASRINRQK